MVLLYYANEFMLAYRSPRDLHSFFHRLLKQQAIVSCGPLTSFLGITVTRDATTTTLSQQSMIISMLTEHQMLSCNRTAVPMIASTLLTTTPATTKPDPLLQSKYRQIATGVRALALGTRPDLAFVSTQLMMHINNPDKPHMDAALHVLRYLKGTTSRSLTYRKGGPTPLQLQAWADADWGACTETRKSYSGWLTSLQGAAITWASNQQTEVATSTAHAEYLSANECSRNLQWLRLLFQDLGIPQPRPVPIYEDNRACKMMSDSRAMRERSKHIDYAYNNLRDHVASDTVQLLDCPTIDMVADSMTKNLPAPSFVRHTNVQMGQALHNSPPMPPWPVYATADAPGASLYAYLRR